MSFQAFITRLQEADINMDTLRILWDSTPTVSQNKSIQEFVMILVNKLKVQPTLSQVEFKELLYKYRKAKIDKVIRPTVPLLVQLPNGKYINEDTNIIFDKDTNVALSVLIGDNEYPIRHKEMNVCITNGWMFKTNDPDISSVYRVM